MKGRTVVVVGGVGAGGGIGSDVVGVGAGGGIDRGGAAVAAKVVAADVVVGLIVVVVVGAVVLVDGVVVVLAPTCAAKLLPMGMTPKRFFDLSTEFGPGLVALLRKRLLSERAAMRGSEACGGSFRSAWGVVGMGCSVVDSTLVVLSFVFSAEGPSAPMAHVHLGPLPRYLLLKRFALGQGRTGK